MTDLTEQWNKGELPEGDYYIKRRNGLLLYDNIDSRGVWRNNIDEDIVEVLAPVPSYEEYERLNWYAGNGVEENIKLKTENKWYSEQLNEAVKKITKLKELLNECKQWFDWYHIDTGAGKEYIESWHKKGREIHQKINQALGEDK